nr:hypothetical protein [Treponema sp.]
GYLRNPSRNTEDKKPEAALYNIAGTAFMDDGLYFNLGDQLIFKKYTNELNDTEYTDDTIVYLFPNAEIVFKTGDFAVFGSFGVYGGGGSLNYDDGTALTYGLFGKYAQSYAALAQANSNTTYAALAQAFSGAMNDHSLSIYSATFGEQIGASYNYDDFASFGAAFRLLQGSQSISITTDNATFQSLNGGDELGYDSSALGFAFVFGGEIKPLEALSVTAQFQTQAKLEYEYTDVTGNFASSLGYEEGSKYRNDLPAVLNLGVAYQLLDNLNLSTSFNYYFDQYTKHTGDGSDLEYDPSFEFMLGADYALTEKLTLSMGGLLNRTGSTSDANNIVNPALNSFAFGCGGMVQAMDNLWFELGAMYSGYFEGTYDMSGYDVKLNKSVPMLSLGVTFKPL